MVEFALLVGDGDHVVVGLLLVRMLMLGGDVIIMRVVVLDFLFHLLLRLVGLLDIGAVLVGLLGLISLIRIIEPFLIHALKLVVYRIQVVVILIILRIYRYSTHLVALSGLLLQLAWILRPLDHGRILELF